MAQFDFYKTISEICAAVFSIETFPIPVSDVAFHVPDSRVFFCDTVFYGGSSPWQNAPI